MADGQQGNVLKRLKIEVTSNVHVVILQTLLFCLKYLMKSRFETILLFSLRELHIARMNCILKKCIIIIIIIIPLSSSSPL